MCVCVCVCVGVGVCRCVQVCTSEGDGREILIDPLISSPGRGEGSQRAAEHVGKKRSREQ